MAPQLYISVYKEQFASPGRAKREQLRPTSAHRRNNPQPRPDFLFPRSLLSNYRPRHMLSHPLPPVDTGRPLLPPVRHLSFHNPVTTCPDIHLKSEETCKPNHMPPVSPSVVQPLPSADGLQKLQLIEPPAGPGLKPQGALKNLARTDNQRNVHPLSAQQLRQHAVAQLHARPLTSNPLADRRHFPQTQHWRSSSNSNLDYSSGCYSCFHVVKPYKAGHYIIHPEFVSECLR